jgi:hypothetical protein
MTVTDNCERQQFGKYKPGRARGRCNDDDLNEWAAEVRKRSFCFLAPFSSLGIENLSSFAKTGSGHMQGDS